MPYEIGCSINKIKMRFILLLLCVFAVDPPVIRHAFAEETLRPGPAVFLKCVGGGNPTPEISWEISGTSSAHVHRINNAIWFD